MQALLIPFQSLPYTSYICGNPQGLEPCTLPGAALFPTEGSCGLEKTVVLIYLAITVPVSVSSYLKMVNLKQIIYSSNEWTRSVSVVNDL